MLAVDVQGSHHGHFERFDPLLVGDLLQFHDYGLLVLGRLEQLGRDRLHGCTGGQRLDRPLLHVRIEHVHYFEFGRDLEGNLFQFRAADRIVQGDTGPRDAFLDPKLLLGLHVGHVLQPHGAFALGRPVDLHRGRRPDKRPDHGLVRLLFFRRLLVIRLGGCGGRRDFRGGDQRVQIYLHTGLRNADFPATHGGLRGLERHAVLARRPRDRAGVFQQQLDLFRLLAFLLDQ